MKYLKDKSGRKFLASNALKDRGDFEQVEEKDPAPKAKPAPKAAVKAAPKSKAKQAAPAEKEAAEKETAEKEAAEDVLSGWED